MNFSPKTCLILLAGISAGASAAAMAQTPVSHPTRLCIARPGEEGRVNIAPVTIRLQRTADLTILGEEEVCIEARSEGFQTVSLKFFYPWGAAGEKPRWWETAPVPIRVRNGETVRLVLCMRSQNRDTESWLKTGWHDMWLMVPPDQTKACAPV